MIIKTKIYARLSVLDSCTTQRVAIGTAIYNTKTRSVILNIMRMPMPCSGYFTTEVPQKWEQAQDRRKLDKAE